jgi:hypothetical protein
MGRALLGGWVCERGDFVRVHAVRVHQTEMPGEWSRFSVGSYQKHSRRGWGFRVIQRLDGGVVQEYSSVCHKVLCV